MMYYLILYGPHLSDGVDQFVLVELLMRRIGIVQTLHIDRDATLAQRRPASGKPRRTRRRVRQVRAYRPSGRRRQRRRGFSGGGLIPAGDRGDSRTLGSGSHRRCGCLRILLLPVLVVHRRGGTLLCVASHRSLGRRQWVCVHGHRRMSTARHKNEKNAVS